MKGGLVQTKQPALLLGMTKHHFVTQVLGKSSHPKLYAVSRPTYTAVLLGRAEL
jgi:hypothetical protein